jgi:hypothetical protein
MPTIAGRAAGLFGWSMYDWSVDYSYGSTRFAALTWGSVRSNTAVATATLVATPGNPAMTTGSKVGILYGRNASSYDRKTPLVAGPTAAITLLGLDANTVYHTAAYGVDGLGNTWIGADTLLTTGPVP